MIGYVVVEGHGEVGAVLNLLHRLGQDLGLPQIYWRPPMRLAMTSERSVTHACDIIRLKPDVECLLVLRDDDDGCPATDGPQVAQWLRDQALPFPAAVTLLHREYEVLFLGSLRAIAGQPLVTAGIERPGVDAGARFTGDPESVRDVKGWLSQHYPAQTRYRPTTDQLPLTRLLDFAELRASGVSCFGTLERALRFLSTGGGPGAVYPPPAGTQASGATGQTPPTTPPHP